MGSYSSSRSAARESVGTGSALPDGLEEYPEVLDALCGRSAENPGGCEADRASIILFIEGPELKFCIAPKRGDMVLFGGPLDVAKLAESLDECLAAGRCSWRRKRK